MGWVGEALNALPAIASNTVLSQLAKMVRIDRPMPFEFAVEIDGIVDAGFQTAEGLSDNIMGTSFRTAGSKSKTTVYTTERKPGTVTLKKGLSYAGELGKWFYECANWQKGKKSPLRDVSFLQLQRLPTTIPYLGGMLVEVKRWEYPNSICNKISAPQFNAMAGAISVEKIVIECQTPDLIEPPTTFGTLGSLLDKLVK